MDLAAPPHIAAVSVAYVAVVPRYVSAASSGTSSWKLNETVPGFSRRGSLS